jgi:C6 transcription factor Pro1
MFEQLSDERLLRSLVWPMCITGCLAEKEQEEWFRGLVMGMSAEVFMFGSARSALRIIERC